MEENYTLDLIDSHLSLFFDEDDILVFHEKESALIHVDVFFVKPSKDREFTLLVTCGMSCLPMSVPENLAHLRHIEIMMLLPPNWNLEKDFKNNYYYWPVRMLQQLAKYPHQHGTWLGSGHTIPISKASDVGHDFRSIILLESITLSEEFTCIEGKKEDVHLYAAIPLYKEEADYKRKNGTTALLNKLDTFNIDEIVDVNRKNVCQPG